MPRLVIASLAVAVLSSAVVLSRTHPRAIERAGLDVWNVPGLLARYRESEERGCDLAAEQEAGRVRTATYARVTDDLVAGRVSLPEAENTLLALYEARPGWLAALRAVEPDAATDRERLNRTILRWVAAAIPDDWCRRAEVLARVRGESPTPVRAGH